ncbi:hypothetical protein [Escherichia coli]|uniref:hypothetical protein n=1 Tax=Escherichia coli TaxID=562 RepID=UPI003D7BA36B
MPASFFSPARTQTLRHTENPGQTGKAEKTDGRTLQHSVNDRKITADGKEGPGDRSGEAYPCIPASPAKMEARHSPHTTRWPHN